VAAEDGKIVWESALSSDVDALFAACMSEAKKTGLRKAYKILQHATTPLAAYADGVIAFGFMSRAKSGYWGLDAATGKHLWHDPGLVTGVASELMAFAPGGAKPVFIGVRRQGRGSQVVALEAKSGKELWKVPTQGSVCWLARQGHDIVASGDGYLAAIGTAGSAVSVRWEQECPVRTHYARPMIVGDRVVVAENSTGLVIYDLGKGNELYRDATKGAGCLGDYVQPIAADGRLYAFGGVRELDISKGCPFNKSEVAVTAKAFDPSPVRYMWPLIVDGRLIAHCSTRIACWDLRQSTTIGKETK
jgi:outer membrane protein assembly factor BamB